jgi:MOSC domain-containing protein YiiM
MISKNAHPRFRCGVLGVVTATGQIAAGDPVAVELPLSGWQALPAL